MAKAWNAHPDESYEKQGIIINRDQEAPSFFLSNEWFQWIKDLLNLSNDLQSCHKWQYHTFKKRC